MLLPHQPGSRALHNAGRGDGARRCRAPAESARRGHEGRVSGESRGEGEFTHELVVALLLGACASGDDGRKGGGVGQERKAAARKRPADFLGFSVAFSWGACLPSWDEFVFVSLCLSPSFQAGKSHGPHGRPLRHLGQLLVFRFH